MSKDPWYESDKPSRLIGGTAGWVAIIVLALIAISAGAWAVKVATSDIAGAGNAVIEKNSSTNRIAKQERFEVLYADIKAADKKVTLFHETLVLSPADPTAKQNYVGAKAYCLDLVAQYNAEARKFSSEDFRAVDLPPQIDEFDSTTDCLEATK